MEGRGIQSRPFLFGRFVRKTILRDALNYHADSANSICLAEAGLGVDLLATSPSRPLFLGDPSWTAEHNLNPQPRPEKCPDFPHSPRLDSG